MKELASIFALLVLTGCSLLVNRDPHTYDLVSDAGTDAGPPPLAAPTLRFPWNGYMTGSALTGALNPPLNARRPRFIWEPVDGATSYEIQLSWHCEAPTRQTCDFTDPVNGATASTEWRPESPLDVLLAAPVGRRWFWRVRACREAECFDYSEVRYVDVGRMPTDFNGDGYADLFVGEQPLTGSGIPTLYDGPDFTQSRNVGAPPDMGREAVVAAAGDINADGFPEMLVLSPQANLLYIFGRNGNRLEPQAGITSYDVLPSGGGDFNGDGYADVAVGFVTPDDAGSAAVYLGSGLGIDTSAPYIFTSPNPTAGGLFGQFVSLASDLNGDGYADLLVGAPEESAATVAQAGRTYLYPGGPNGPGGPITIPNPEPMLRGGFGSVHSGGDLNCDGIGDFVVGASKIGAPGIYAYYGARSGTPRQGPLLIPPAGAPSTSSFGAQATVFRDVNGDGASDFFTSISTAVATVDVPGAALWLGQCDADIETTGRPVTSISGSGTSGIDDTDADGLGELTAFGTGEIVVFGWDTGAVMLSPTAHITHSRGRSYIAGLR